MAKGTAIRITKTPNIQVETADIFIQRMGFIIEKERKITIKSIVNLNIFLANSRQEPWHDSRSEVDSSVSASLDWLLDSVSFGDIFSLLIQYNSRGVEFSIESSKDS
jgi:hypothetical protein